MRICCFVICDPEAREGSCHLPMVLEVCIQLKTSYEILVNTGYQDMCGLTLLLLFNKHIIKYSCLLCGKYKIGIYSNGLVVFLRVYLCNIKHNMCSSK